MERPVIIAEIGCNHKGDMKIAHKMIKLLGVFKTLNPDSAIDISKFQKSVECYHFYPKGSLIFN